MAEAKVRFVEGLQFVGVGPSGHALVMDGREQGGGLDSAPRPGEIVLLAHAGCTGMDVVSILRKMRIDIQEFEVKVSADAAKEHPKVWTKVHLEFRLRSANATPEKVEHAISLSHEKYCSVGAMLGTTAEITHSLVLEKPQGRGPVQTAGGRTPR